MVSLSHAENMARSASRRITDHHQAARKQAITDDAELAVVFARVLELDGCALENDCCVREVQTALGNRLRPLTGSKVTRMGYCSYKNHPVQGDEGPQRRAT